MDGDRLYIDGELVVDRRPYPSRAEAGAALSGYADLERKLNPALTVREAFRRALKALPVAGDVWDKG